LPFLASFSCLWCGTPHTVRAADDLEGWAQLCPECVGKAGDNAFLRFRLRQALTERSAAARGASAEHSAPAYSAPAPGASGRGASAPEGSPTPSAASPAVATREPPTDLDRAMVDYYEARAPEYDDWYLRRGRYARGAIHDAAWNAELDAAGRWLDALPWQGELVELAAGTGWWSPLLASRGELSLYDASPAALDLARDRLLAHRLRAHLHVRDVWAEPDRPVDGLFMGFWLSHVPRARLGEFLALARRWLKPDGRFAAIDSLPDSASGAADHPEPADDLAVRRLADGREFTIVKAYHQPDELATALTKAGFTDVEVTVTGRFFVLASARAA
jgi:demethylmenaquinone methyltransferase/2-methoxy-6-polyprenyl-1,4-benzoquinol methylase